MNAAAHKIDSTLAVDVPASAGVRGSALVARWQQAARERRKAAGRHSGSLRHYLRYAGRIYELCAEELESILNMDIEKLKALLIGERGHTPENADRLIKSYPKVVMNGMLGGAFSLEPTAIALEMADQEKQNVPDVGAAAAPHDRSVLP